MKNFIGIIIGLLISTSSLLAQQPNTTQLKDLVSWTPIVEMDNRVYPSYVWATSNWNYLKSTEYNPYYFGDSEGQLGITYKNLTSTASSVKLVVEAPEMMRKTEYSCYVSQNEQVVEIFPEIDYDYFALLKNRQPRPVLLKFSLYVNGELYGQKTQHITLMSIYDCPYGFVHRSGVFLDQNFMFAAYVNENHPKINDVLLPEAMKTGIIDQITGYLTYSQGTEQGVKDVFLQVFSLWEALRERNIKYSSITGDNSTNQVADQHVRSIDQTLVSSQANCIDGTVLMASVLYKMGIEPIIVLVPGHAYLGFYTGPEGHEDRIMFFLETTLISSDINVDMLSDEMLNFGNGIATDEILTNHQDSFVAFLYALQHSTNDYKKNQAKFNGTDISYRSFEVATYRRLGLLPISF